MSFEEVRNALVIAFADGYLNEEEFSILYDYYQSVNPLYPYWEFDSFCIDNFSSSECQANFRGEKT